MYKVDFHTHSVASPDGGITHAQYRKALESGLLDCIAVTDHNRIDMAELLHQEFGEKIIVGEEIMTTDGEIVGLYLETQVAPNLTPLQTVEAIKQQGGIVYIPHPFETVRKGLHPQVLEELLEHIDIIEVCNGRAFVQNHSKQTVVWARINEVTGAASSDAHGFSGLGKTYTQLSQIPTRENLMELMQHGVAITARPTVRSLLYPKLNRARKKIRRHA